MHLPDWLTTGPIPIITKVVALIVIAFVVRLLSHRGVNRLVRRTADTDRSAQRFLGHTRAAEALTATRPWRRDRQSQRAAAMGSLINSCITALLAAVLVFMALGVLGYNLAPILASAGVVGVALGFGAQNLVKDFLAGVAMIMEDQFGVGDVVDLELASGTVEAVGLRVTRLRDPTGLVWYVRNGEVVRVGNKSQGWSQILLSVQIAYDEDVARVTGIIERVIAEVTSAPEVASVVIDPPIVVGVDAVTGTAVTLLLVGTCATNKNFGIQRDIRRRLKEEFDLAGVRLPPPMPPWTGSGTGPA